MLYLWAPFTQKFDTNVKEQNMASIKWQTPIFTMHLSLPAVNASEGFCFMSNSLCKFPCNEICTGKANQLT